MADRHAELQQMLVTLRLPAVGRLFPDVALQAAKAGWTHEAFLYELMRSECEQREQHRIARVLRQSGLPAEKTFHTLEQARFPLVIQQQLERLKSGRFVDQAVNVVAVGKPGTGKTHPIHCPHRHECSGDGTA